MSPLAVRVENLGKKYVIRHEAAPRYRTLRETISRRASRFFQRKGESAAGTREEFWALQDVSFDLLQGQVTGIIGRNGAGKSTLLKLLSRITEPSTGSISLNGRVASLLEVGTGFHPELTGRENVYLNGAVLGMSRHEIRRKFDEIVAFAETEKFLDTPVKHYSSGMYMRLAFAVAAHLEPEILIVDEVLAVGDAEFQTKCLGKMREVSEGGRTVLLVSHNMTAIGALCQHGILLAEGRLAFAGQIQETISRYREVSAQPAEVDTTGRILKRARLVQTREALNEPGLIFDFEFEVEPSENKLGLDLVLRHENVPVCALASAYYGGVTFDRSSRRVTCSVGPLNLASGTYELDVLVCRPMLCWIEENLGVCRFEVDRQHFPGTTFELTARRNLGYVIPMQTWKVDPPAWP